MNFMHFRWICFVLSLSGCFVASGLSAISASNSSSSDPSSTQPSITIIQEPAIIQRVMFDRFHKNPSMPTTLPGEAALTQSDYECAAAVTYSIDHEEFVKGRCHLMAKIAVLKMTTKLIDKIFLPQLAPVELRAHEEGHRKMNEQIYLDGNAVAWTAARELLDQEWPGEGVDEDAAGKAATDAAVQKLCNEYLRHTSKRSSELGDIYDKFTNHGRNALLVANAIRLSFEKEKQINATQPATTQVSLSATN